MKNIAFRMDDVGASTKKFEVYSKKAIGNILFLKYHFPFKAWGPYDELLPEVWDSILRLLFESKARMTVAITASWVEENGALIPFPEKFPAQSKIIKDGLRTGLLEIANHGLTHCIVGKHLPRLFFSNRKYHREFYEYVQESVVQDHLKKSQEILESFFERKIITFTPPGNVCSPFTKNLTSKFGLKIISAKEDNTFAFHDRDIVLHGTNWLKDKIDNYKSKGYNIVQVKDL